MRRAPGFASPGEGGRAAIPGAVQLKKGRSVPEADVTEIVSIPCLAERSVSKALHFTKLSFDNEPQIATLIECGAHRAAE